MALSDYFRPDLFRPRNLVPAFVAVVVVAGAWFVIRPSQPNEPLIVSAQAAPVEDPSPEPPPEAETEIHPTVLVARRDIGRGVLLNMDLLEWREQIEPVDLSRAVIQDAVPLGTVVGSVARHGIGAGELITWDKLVMSGMPGFVTSVLSPGHRAMTVSVDEATTRAQIIYPGDHVDVILVHSPGSGGVPAEQSARAGPASQVIVHDVRVLAVGSATLDLNRYGTTVMGSGGAIQRPEPPQGETYTLEVTTQDAERIALAAVAGRLTLVVRPVVAAASVARTAPYGIGFGETSGPVHFSEVMPGLAPTEEDLVPPAPTIRIIRGRGGSSDETLAVRDSAGADAAAALLAEALRGD